MERILEKNWLIATLTILGLIYPMQFHEATARVKPAQPAVTPTKTVSKKLAATRPAESTSQNPIGPVYTYLFSGQAVSDGQPLANTRLEIRVTSEYGADIHYTTTDKDGNYTLPVSVMGHPNQTLSWEIRGVTPDLKQVNQEGRQILTDKHVVQLAIPLPFAEI